MTTLPQSPCTVTSGTVREYSMETNRVPVPQHPQTCGQVNGPPRITVILPTGLESMISGHPKHWPPSPFILKQIEVSHDVSGGVQV